MKNHKHQIQEPLLVTILKVVIIISLGILMLIAKY